MSAKQASQDAKPVLSAARQKLVELALDPEKPIMVLLAQVSNISNADGTDSEKLLIGWVDRLMLTALLARSAGKRQFTLTFDLPGEADAKAVGE